MSGRGGNGVPLEDFIQALSSQLDRVQSGMALKVKAGLPLTFAVKDLSIDLKAHVDVDGPVVRIRSAGPGDTDASTLRLAMTTITRPLMEENTASATADPTDTSLDTLGSDLSPDDLRRLEWAGVQTVSQLRRLQESAGESAIGRIANVPALRLRMALDRASQPASHDVLVETPIEAPSRPPLERAPFPGSSEPVAPPTFEADSHSARIRVAGRNLLRDGQPTVRLGDERLHVVTANPGELLVRAPVSGILSGTLEIETPAGVRLRHQLSDGSGQ
jgi:hypothetical protein